LCAVTFALSLVLVALNGLRGPWCVYERPRNPWHDCRDEHVTQRARGIEYLLSDKTGMLTQNGTSFLLPLRCPLFLLRGLILLWYRNGDEENTWGTVSCGFGSINDVSRQLHVAFGSGDGGKASVSVYDSSGSQDLHST
jgi:hypothetical protein